MHTEDDKAGFGSVDMPLKSVKGRTIVAVWGKDPFSDEYKRFKEWLTGWLIDVYEVSMYDDDDFIGFKVGKEDMFELFIHMYRKVEIMRKLLGDGIVAICKKYPNNKVECIDMSETSRPMVIISKEDIERLKEVKNEIKVWIDDVVWIPVQVENNNGLIKIGRCEMPVDETLYVVEKILDELFRVTGFKKLLDYKEEIRKATRGLATYLPRVKTRHGFLGIGVNVEGCEFTLENNETLILVYNILTKVIEQLEEWHKAWEEIKDEVKTIDDVKKLVDDVEYEEE